MADEAVDDVRDVPVEVEPGIDLDPREPGLEDRIEGEQHLARVALGDSDPEFG